MEEKHDEKWLLSRGWQKHKGFKLNHEMIDVDWETSYWTKEAASDLLTECEFYDHPDKEEFATEDLDECVELEEEILEDEKEEANSKKERGLP